MHSFGQDEVSLPLSINATPKSIGIISTINTPVLDGNSKGKFGLSTNQTKLYLKYRKNKTIVIFEVPNASEILSKGFGAKTVSNNAVAWTLDTGKVDQHKFYITTASDSAQNYIIYSGYLYFPNLNKWKLIASYKVNGYTEHIHTASIFKSTNIQQNIEELFTDTWTQGDNGAWINVQNKGIEKPILPPFSDLDSLYRVKQDSLMIRKAILENQTDAVAYKNGLYYHVMKSSENQSLVKITDTVSIYYKGYIFGTDIVFDQTTNDTRTFPLARLIKGWQVGLEGTRVGEKVKLLIPSGLAYSIRTRSPKIPPNSILVFEIETVKAVN
jgi:hypothetical protein